MLGAALCPGPLVLPAVAGGAHGESAMLLGAMESLSALGVMFVGIGGDSLRAAVPPTTCAAGSPAPAARSTTAAGRSAPLSAAGWERGPAIRPTLLSAGVCGALSGLWLLLSSVPGVKVVPGTGDES